jgi:hypothetical protein
MLPEWSGRAIVAANAAPYHDQDQQRAMYAVAGYNGKPKSISRDEFNDLVDEGSGVKEGWRGVVTDIPESRGGQEANRAIARSFVDGDEHFPGRGIYGNGTYVAYHPGGKTEQSRLAAEGYGDSLIRMAIPDRIIDTPSSDIERVGAHIEDAIYPDGVPKPRPTSEHGRDLYDTAQELVRRGREAGLSDEDLFMALGDDGRVAIALGLDGYTVKNDNMHTNSVEYVVVLNRAAITVDRTVYTGDGITARHLADGHDSRGNPFGRSS